MWVLIIRWVEINTYLFLMSFNDTNGDSIKSRILSLRVVFFFYEVFFSFEDFLLSKDVCSSNKFSALASSIKFLFCSKIGSLILELLEGDFLLLSSFILKDKFECKFFDCTIFFVAISLSGLMSSMALRQEVGL
jgi:hypothetical protein